MSINKNCFREITYNELIDIQRRDELFLLFFKGSDKNKRSVGALESCNEICPKYPLVKCYAINWDSYSLYHTRTSSCRIYNVVKFRGCKEVRYVTASFDLNELDDLFSSTQKTCEEEHRNLQKSQQSSEDQLPDISEMLRTNEINLEKDIKEMFELYVEKNKSPEHNSPMYSSENLGVVAASLPSMSDPMSSLHSSKYEETYHVNPKMTISVPRSPRRVSPQFTGHYVSPNHSIQPAATIGSNTSEISTDLVTKLPSNKSPVRHQPYTYQILPPSSGNESRTSKRTPRRKTSSRGRSKTQSQSCSVTQPPPTHSHQCTIAHIETSTQPCSHTVTSFMPGYMPKTSTGIIVQPRHSLPNQAPITQHYPQVMGSHPRQQHRTHPGSSTSTNRLLTKSKNLNRGNFGKRYPPNQ